MSVIFTSGGELVSFDTSVEVIANVVVSFDTQVDITANVTLLLDTIMTLIDPQIIFDNGNGSVFAVDQYWSDLKSTRVTVQELTSSAADNDFIGTGIGDDSYVAIQFLSLDTLDVNNLLLFFRDVDGMMSVFSVKDKLRDEIFNARFATPEIDIEEGSNGYSSSSITLLKEPLATNESIIYPNGGETLTIGSVATLSWVAIETAAVYNLRYSTNNGTTWSFITSVTGIPEYSWTVPNEPTTQALLKVTAVDASGSFVDNAISNNTFTIGV